MAKKKRGPALFEVLEESAEEPSGVLKVPRWWARTGPQPPGEETAKPPRKARQRPPPDAEVSSERSESFLEVDGGRIRVSLTSISAAAVVFIALCGLLGTYELGLKLGFADGVRASHRVQSSASLNELEEARLQAPATYLISDLLTDGAGTALAAESDDAPGAELAWTRGHTHVVAQEFAAGRLEDAERARQFLAESGVQTTLVSSGPNGTLQLITTKGYDHNDPEQKRLSTELLEQEHRAGEAYFAQGGGYRLKGYFKTLKADHW